jgi:hypothetical protein
MNVVVIPPAVVSGQAAPVRIPLPADGSLNSDCFTLVDLASGEQIPAQRDGEKAVIAVIGPLASERRFRVEPAAAGQEGVRVGQKGPQEIEISVGGQLLTAYHYDPANARPFFYPVIGPTGQSVTRHYPMQPDLPGEDHDHKHHRSMWSAYGEVNGADNWSEEQNHARQIPRGQPEMISGPVFGRLTALNQWVGPDGKPQLDERRVLTVYHVGPERRLFDYELTLTAAAGELQFGDTKEGGLLSFRVASSMDASKGQGRIENSAGGVGEKACWGKPAEWCDYSGPVAGETVGIAVMDHPGNFRSPVHWHVRDYGLMTTNCFGDSTFAGEEGGRRGDYTLKPSHSLTFRYRVLLHRGHAAEGGAAEAFAAYTHPPTIRLE